jgi:hypothetical protein
MPVLLGVGTVCVVHPSPYLFSLSKHETLHLTPLPSQQGQKYLILPFPFFTLLTLWFKFFLRSRNSISEGPSKKCSKYEQTKT